MLFFCFFFAFAGIRPLASPCCNKKKLRGPPIRPKIPAIKCPRPPSSVSKRKAQLSPSLSLKLVSGEVGDPHHDVPWHGRAKCYITDPSVSPNLTPPGRQSFRTPQQKAESIAKRLAQGHWLIRAHFRVLVAVGKNCLDEKSLDPPSLLLLLRPRVWEFVC